MKRCIGRLEAERRSVSTHGSSDEHNGRQEGRHGGDRRGAARLRHRAHAGQPQGVRRRGRAGWLRSLAARPAGAGVRPRGPALADPVRAAALRRAASARGRRAGPAGARRPAGELPAPGSRAGQLRGPNHALGWSDHRIVRGLPRPRPDHRGAQPARGVRPDLPQRDVGLPVLVRGAGLHRGGAGARFPRPARGVGGAAQPRCGQCRTSTGGPDGRARLLGPAHRGLLVRAVRGLLRGGSLMLSFTVGEPIADSAVPDGSLETSWERRKFAAGVVNPANRRRLTVIVVGTGLAGASAAASLAELGYRVRSFCYQDSPRRAHSIAAQGGINAAKNYRNDGDSVYRLFHDTLKGGDFRSREANVYRLAELSTAIIDQAVAQGVPFAREYGGLLDTRSFGGAQVARTFYARGQTGQQLLLGAYQAMARQVAAGRVIPHTRHEMLDVIVSDRRARGVVVRDLVTGDITTHRGEAVVLATGGYGDVSHLSTNPKGCNATAIWRAHRRGAL